MAKIWGGTEIGRLKGISGQQNIGESFELSGMAGSETVVAEGEFAGRTLRDLLHDYGTQILGQHNAARFGTDFPLLIKFISAADDLSIQVHPDDAMAQELGHPFGKNEMWFVVKADADAHLLAGFRKGITAARYDEALVTGTLIHHINVEPTYPGDCFYIPAGCIHSIGKGNLLIEIQQSSDDTFRVYDFDRMDANGQKRELHKEEARRALNYDDTRSHRVNYAHKTRQVTTLVSSPSFTTRLCPVNAPIVLDYKDLDSFVIYVIATGAARFTDAEGHSLTLTAGSTVLFPAENTAVSVVPTTADGCTFLEVSIP